MPKLIDVLVAVFEHMEMVPTTVVSNNPLNNLGMYSGGPGGASGVSLGGFSSFSGRSIGYLTPPAIAPGAIAFGGASTSLGNLAGGGYGGGGNVSVVPQPTVVRDVINNALVLEALRKLTNQNFGFDVATWKRWVATSFTARRDRARKVNEPLNGTSKSR